MKINDLTIEGLEEENYFATQELIDVVNAAIFLDKPLLIEGPAGTGKTFLAKTLSSLLNFDLIFKIRSKSIQNFGQIWSKICQMFVKIMSNLVKFCLSPLPDTLWPSICVKIDVKIIVKFDVNVCVRAVFLCNASFLHSVLLLLQLGLCI